MSVFHQDVFAASSKKSYDSKINTLTKALAPWGFHPLPLEVDKVFALGATLKFGGYNSSESYLSAYKGLAERNGQ